MRVICTDGTTFTCQGFELSEYGVALYGQNLAQEKERYEDEPQQTGYVPHERLWYILPEDVEPKMPVPGAQQGQPVGQPPAADQQPPMEPQGPPVHPNNGQPQRQQPPGLQGQPNRR